MGKIFEIIPVGFVDKKKQDVHIMIYDEFSKALLGLNEFSHIIVFTWLHANDMPNKRKLLKVHPKGDRKKPMRGVFATRSPVRPNPIGISTCELLELTGSILKIDNIDAFDKTPVIDIKPYIPDNELLQRLRVPNWVFGNKKK